MRETTKRRESEGERWDEDATAETGGRRGTSSRGEGGCTHDARMASPGFLLSSPRLSRAPLASGRQVEGGNLRGLSALPSLPLFNTSKELRNSNQLVSGAKISTRVEGRSYPPLYRAHKWAKGGWAYLRPSSFGIYVGLPNRDLHRPQKANKHKSKAGPLNTSARPHNPRRIEE